MIPRVLAALVLVAAATGCQPHAAEPFPSGPATDIVPMTIDSSALGRSMRALIFRPSGFDPSRRYPVLYVLHGYGSDETIWFHGHAEDGVGLDVTAQRLIDEGRICPLIIASAFIANSYGVDSAPAEDQFDHGPYERYLLDDVLRAVEVGAEADLPAGLRFVAGLSMGGFAALHLGLRNPMLFGGIGALSPAAFVDTPADRRWLFGGDPEANDPMRLAKTANLDGLTIFLGNGDADYGWIRDGTAELARRFAARGVTASPVVVPGGHDVGTWRRLAPDMLQALLPPPCG
jgi:enterochelin esterase-like enzyme